MSKLVEWLAAASAILTVWVAVLYHFLEFQIINEYRWIISIFPMLIVIGLGIYSGVTVLWRVYNFNDCNKEAFELQAEIKEARVDLIAKGFIFN